MKLRQSRWGWRFSGFCLIGTMLVAGGKIEAAATGLPLTASDGESADSLGQSVAISGDTAIVGAPTNNGNQGRAFVYLRTGPVWVQQAELSASNGAAGDRFGLSVAIDGNIAIIGAPATATRPGSAYIFVRSGANWALQTRVTASDASANDQFGISVAVNGSTAASCGSSPSRPTTKG